jgi:hypothetical protein
MKYLSVCPVYLAVMASRILPDPHAFQARQPARVSHIRRWVPSGKYLIGDYPAIFGFSYQV